MHARLLGTVMTLMLVATAFAADEDQDAYTGTYTNPEWNGGKMTILIAKTATDGKHAATVNCIWDDGFYSYPAKFDPVGEDGTLVGVCESADGMGDPANYIIKGTVKDGTYTAIYWLEGEDEPATAEDANGTITVVLGAEPQVKEEE